MSLHVLNNNNNSNFDKNTIYQKLTFQNSQTIQLQICKNLKNELKNFLK